MVLHAGMRAELLQHQIHSRPVGIWQLVVGAASAGGTQHSCSTEQKQQSCRHLPQTEDRTAGWGAATLTPGTSPNMVEEQTTESRLFTLMSPVSFLLSLQLLGLRSACGEVFGCSRDQSKVSQSLLGLNLLEGGRLQEGSWKLFSHQFFILFFHCFDARRLLSGRLFSGKLPSPSCGSKWSVKGKKYNKKLFFLGL